MSARPLQQRCLPQCAPRCLSQCAPCCLPLAHPRSEADALAADCLPLSLRLAAVVPRLELRKKLGRLKLELRLGQEMPPTKEALWRLAPPSWSAPPGLVLDACLVDSLLLLQMMASFPDWLLLAAQRRGVQGVELPLSSFWPAEPLQQHGLLRVPADRRPGPAPAGLSSTSSSSLQGTLE